MRSSMEKLKKYKILKERPQHFGGSLIEKIGAKPHDVFSLMEKIYGEYEDLFTDLKWIDSKSNWQWFLVLNNGVVRIYDYRNSVSVGSVSDDILSTLSEELKEEVSELKRLLEEAVSELPKEDRMRVDAQIDANPFQNFISTFEPVLKLIDKAKEDGSLLEGIVLTISCIDALLRNCLILQNQIDNSNEEIDEEYIYQRDESYISERNILKEAKQRGVISVELFDQITIFYNERNKAVHRYFISNFQYKDAEDLLNENLNIIPDLTRRLYEIEEEQIEKGVGITRVASPEKEQLEIDPLLRIDSNRKRIKDIVQPEITSIFEDPKFIKIMETYQMKLDSEPFNKIKTGNKDIELRLHDEKRSKYKVGDPIIFINRANGYEMLARTIKEIVLKDKFSEIFNDGLSKDRAGFNEDDDVDVMMQKYYPQEDISKYGVIGIILEEKKDESESDISD